MALKSGADDTTPGSAASGVWTGGHRFACWKVSVTFVSIEVFSLPIWESGVRSACPDFTGARSVNSNSVLPEVRRALWLHSQVHRPLTFGVLFLSLVSTMGNTFAMVG